MFDLANTLYFSTVQAGDDDIDGRACQDIGTMVDTRATQRGAVEPTDSTMAPGQSRPDATHTVRVGATAVRAVTGGGAIDGLPPPPPHDDHEEEEYDDLQEAADESDQGQLGEEQERQPVHPTPNPVRQLRFEQTDLTALELAEELGAVRQKIAALLTAEDLADKLDDLRQLHQEEHQLRRQLERQRAHTPRMLSTHDRTAAPQHDDATAETRARNDAHRLALRTCQPPQDMMFSGSPTEDASDWFSAMRQTASFKGILTETREACDWLAQNFTGAAKDWWTGRRRGDPELVAIDSWTTMEEAVIKQFPLFAPDSVNRRKLINLKTGTSGVLAYTQEFNRLCRLLSDRERYPESALKEYYYAGLPERYRKALSGQYLRLARSQLQEEVHNLSHSWAVAAAVGHAGGAELQSPSATSPPATPNEWRKKKHHKGKQPARVVTKGPTTPGKNGASTSAAAAATPSQQSIRPKTPKTPCKYCGKMHWQDQCPARNQEQRVVQRVPASTPQLTEAQRKEYMEKGLCFKCGKPGHSSRHCKRSFEMANNLEVHVTNHKSGRQDKKHKKSNNHDLGPDDPLD